MHICPKCKIDFDKLHHRCSSKNTFKLLQTHYDKLWNDIGHLNLTVDRLYDQIAALKVENAELRLKKDGVVVDSISVCKEIDLKELGEDNWVEP